MRTRDLTVNSLRIAFAVTSVVAMTYHYDGVLVNAVFLLVAFAGAAAAFVWVGNRRGPASSS